MKINNPGICNIEKLVLAPIALFVYNRPWHTRQTVEALQKNTLASQSDLIIFSDSSKSEDQIEAVNSVRDYIHKIKSFKSVTIIERETNYGLAKSIIDGVTSIINAHGRIIVLEDDLVTSPYFLDFMNTALNIYQAQERVMSISGYTFPIDKSNLTETFFLELIGCWGWATWDRAWQYFEKDSNQLLNDFTKAKIYRFNLEGAYDFWSQVQANEKGTINTWAIFWYASVFQKNGLCLHPTISMVNNIGHDGTGVHCNGTDKFYCELAKNPVTYFEDNVAENSIARSKIKLFFLSTKFPFLFRLYSIFKNKVSHINSIVRS